MEFYQLFSSLYKQEKYLLLLFKKFLPQSR